MLLVFCRTEKIKQHRENTVENIQLIILGLCQQKTLQLGSAHVERLNILFLQNHLRMTQCYCEDCRKLTETGHVSNAFFKEDDVDICELPNLNYGIL